jgi:hypothetical protein
MFWDVKAGIAKGSQIMAKKQLDPPSVLPHTNIPLAIPALMSQNKEIDTQKSSNRT